MPSRQFPGLNLLGGWNTGEADWGGAMNANLRQLSAIAGSRVLSRVTTLPGSGTAGDIFIVPAAAPTNANRVAVWDQGSGGTPAWVYFTAQVGWHFYVVDEGINVQWTGTEWEEFAGAGGGGGGGGGQSYMLPSNQLPAIGGGGYSTSNYAAKGMLYQAEDRLAIHRMDFDVSNVGAGTYKAVLALVSGGTNTISSILYESDPVTPTGAGLVSFGVNDGLTINAGQDFAALLVRTDGAGTAVCDLRTIPSTGGPSTSHVTPLGLILAANNNPAPSDALGAESVGNCAAVALVYTLEADGGSHLPVRDVYINQPVQDARNTVSTSVNTSAQAIKASVYEFTEIIQINELHIWLMATTGSQYRLFVGRLNGSDELTEVLSLTDVIDAPATGEHLAFDGSLQVGPGDRIIIGAMRVDGSGTTAARTTLVTSDPIPGWTLIHTSTQTRNTLTLSDSFPSNSASVIRIRAIYTRSGATAALLYDRLVLENPAIPVDDIITLVSADFRGNKVLQLDSATSVLVRVPFGVVATQPISFIQRGVGAVYFEGASGVSILAADDADHTRTQYSMATLMPSGANTFLLVGDIA